ncbi:24196_t:CDS:2, partial [Entrophospora sp. SA101]
TVITNKTARFKKNSKYEIPNLKTQAGALNGLFIKNVSLEYQCSKANLKSKTNQLKDHLTLPLN